MDGEGSDLVKGEEGFDSEGGKVVELKRSDGRREMS